MNLQLHPLLAERDLSGLIDLNFHPLEPETNIFPLPVISASSSYPNLIANYAIDNLTATYWQSETEKQQFITMDLKQSREFGGLKFRLA